MHVIGTSEQGMEKGKVQSCTLKKYLEIQHSYKNMSVAQNML
jgi:hypothetical protein